MILKRILRIAGKDDFSLDKNIPTTYLLRICFRDFIMMLRGNLIAIFYRNISNRVFIASKVSLFQKRRITIGKYTRLYHHVKIDALSTHGVYIGKRCVFCEHVTIEATGSLKQIGKGIRIGDGSCFGACCFFGAAGGIEIGDNVIGGQNIRFHSENHNYKDKTLLIKDQGVTHQGITVGDNCWIGAGAVFLDGSKIGNGCVVAANAVVTREFEDDSIIAGMPAKCIGTR